jgi:hypothetical protein
MAKWSKKVVLRKGKLGGAGYTTRPWAERKRILDVGVKSYGYPSMLGSIQFLRNIGAGRQNPTVRRNLDRDHTYLVDTYGARRDARRVARQMGVQLDLDALIRQARRRRVA